MPVAALIRSHDASSWIPVTGLANWPMQLLDREPEGVNLAGKVKNLFLVTIDVYRLENRKIEVCRVSGGGGTHGWLGPPRSVKFHK